MAKKINLSQEVKNYLKQNFDTVRAARLSKDELSYYNKIKGGKAAARKALRIGGKFLSKDSPILEYIEPIARSKGLTVKRYLLENRESVQNFIDNGYDIAQRRSESYMNDLEQMKTKYVYVEDSEGNVKRMSRIQVMKNIADLKQKASSLSTIVSIAIKTKVYLDGKIVYVMPSTEEIEDIETGEDLINILDNHDCAYIESEKKK